jgi:toxin ParE1/3/4
VAELTLAKAAEHDLRNLRKYSKAAFGLALTRDYLLGLRNIFQLLRDQPFAGQPESDLGEGLRGISYRSHRIYYQVRADCVLIVRVLHHSRDVVRHLGSSA